MTQPDPKQIARRNTRMALALFALVFGMVGLSYAAVPLYDLFCRATGLDGTTQVAATAGDEVLDQTIKVRFDANISPSLPWSFKPEVNEVEVKIGAMGQVAYLAENQINAPTAGMALYNVTPKIAGQYFSKIQCFCFDNQPLEPGQKARMPVFFTVDPEITRDRATKHIHTITLSYTFYPAKTDELETAKSDFYDRLSDSE